MRRKMTRVCRWLPMAVSLSLVLTAVAPAQSPLVTRWAKDVTPQNVHPEYPRPQMARKAWTNLNGSWDFAMAAAGDAVPASFTEKILVPFPVESRLSGVQRRLPAGGTLWYRRTFTRPSGNRVLLHFGAVDWSTRVWVNGHLVGRHEGGYDPFSFDITAALTATGPQQVRIAVQDPSDDGVQPRGKQVNKPEGIYYTPSSGIWQTVWLEGLPKSSIADLKIDASLKTGRLQVQADIRGGGTTESLRVQVIAGDRTVATGTAPTASPVKIRLTNPRPWSPESAYLYRLKVSLLDRRNRVIDAVESYAGFRDVAVGRAQDGRTRILLNGKPTVMVGPLDQGFWPDGLYTAPTDAAMKYDLVVTKRLGFNMIRKHVKVEPATWYAACDRMGILVFQDMPSGDRNIGPNDPDIERTPESKAIYERELKAMIDTHRNHPSIVAWVTFNEGWGQFDTARIAAWTKQLDPTRLVDAVTGWADRGVGDMHDWHVYPGPGSPRPEPARAAALGEFGGLGLVTPGHMWQSSGWGYQSFKTADDLTTAFERIFTNLHLLVREPGLSMAVYTQTTDVETESNGLMTYDRAVIKMDPKRVRAAVTALYRPAPRVTTVVRTSERTPQTWRWTTSAPAGAWTDVKFDDADWKVGPGGFGTPETPGAAVGTRWDSRDIWMRRTIELPRAMDNLSLRIHHDDTAEVFVDGKQVAAIPGWTSAYTLFPLPGLRLSKGRHTLAVHCHQDAGGQFIDVGLAQLGK